MNKKIKHLNKMVVHGIEVQIVRKAIKNLNLTVYPPDGHVRVAVPMFISNDQVRQVVISRLNWIRKKQAYFLARPLQSSIEMVSGEKHFVFGKPYGLEVVERRGRHRVILKNETTLQLFVNPGTTFANRLLVLNEWYRVQLKSRIPILLKQWQATIGVEVSDWGVKKMKTRWGSCNISHGRIWLNLELAKKPLECLEYVVVHELVHLLERYHNDVFQAYMDRFLPGWRRSRAMLMQEPVRS